MDRRYWLRQIEALDPDTDYEQIYRITTSHEFPWDTNQALSFALFRTYAVPSIGSLLASTGEFTERVQKRYDDTALILGAVGEQGLDSPEGRNAIRRMNQMHGYYGISNDDLRYVLSTFVVMPIRWMDAYGWRPLTEREKVASTNYFHQLGRRMAIRDIPATWREFSDLMDAYERKHFAFDAGGRAVADSTLKLMTTFPPFSAMPARYVTRISRGLMDGPLLAAFRYRPLTKVEAAVYRAGLKVRGRLLRLARPRMKPRLIADLSWIRSYPNGHDVRDLGTFAAHVPGATGGPDGGPGATVCPVPHPATGS